MFLVFLLSFAQRPACDDGRFGETVLIGIDDQPLTALEAISWVSRRRTATRMRRRIFCSGVVVYRLAPPVRALYAMWWNCLRGIMSRVRRAQCKKR